MFTRDIHNHVLNGINGVFHIMMGGTEVGGVNPLERPSNTVEENLSSYDLNTTEGQNEADGYITAELKNNPGDIDKKLLERYRNKISAARAHDVEAAAKKDPASPEMKEAIQTVHTETAKKVTILKGEVKKSLKDSEYNIELNKEMSSATMAALIADLDHGDGVEQTNRGLFRQALFGGSDQKETIGEAQLLMELKKMNKGELDALYKRITGTTTGLPWKANLSQEKSQRATLTRDNSVRSLGDLDSATQTAIRTLQRGIIDQANMMANITEAILGKGGRTGLRSVIEGRTADLQSALNNPDKLARFQEMIKNSPEIKKDPNLLVGIISFLIKIGIQIPVTLFSGGSLMAFVEHTTVTPTGETGGLTVKKGFGESSSVGASLDIAGARLDGKWNDPAQRIMHRTRVFNADLAKPNTIPSQVASSFAQEVINHDFPQSKDIKDTIRSEATRIKDSYVNSMKMLDTSTVSPEQKKSLAEQATFSYLSQIEALKGAQLEGIFAAANTTGLFVGLSGGMVDRSATSDGIKINAGNVEGQALGAQSLTPGQVDEYLAACNITKNTDSTYTDHNTKQTLIIPPGQQVVWHFDKVITAYDEHYTYTSELVTMTGATASKTEQTSSTARVRYAREASSLDDTLHISPAVNTYIQKNLRQGKNSKDFTAIENQISLNDFAGAKIALEALLKKDPKSKIAQKILTRLKEATDLSSFFDTLLNQTSGSRKSHSLADRIQNPKTNVKAIKEIQSYYKNNKLDVAFAKQYGISKELVNQIVADIAPSMNDGTSKSLETLLGTGVFQGVVAFNQKNGTSRFKNIVDTSYTNTPTIGKTMEITDPSAANQIRSVVSSEISSRDIKSWKISLEGAMTPLKFSETEIKALVTQNVLPSSLRDAGYEISKPGTVSAFLSFVANAECFNLGFAVTPPELSKSTITTTNIPGMDPVSPSSSVIEGTTVGIPQTNHFVFGLGAGVTWDSLNNGGKASDTGGSQGSTANNGNTIDNGHGIATNTNGGPNVVITGQGTGTTGGL